MRWPSEWMLSHVKHLLWLRNWVCPKVRKSGRPAESAMLWASDRWLCQSGNADSTMNRKVALARGRLGLNVRNIHRRNAQSSTQEMFKEIGALPQRAKFVFVIQRRCSHSNSCPEFGLHFYAFDPGRTIITLSHETRQAIKNQRS